MKGSEDLLFDIADVSEDVLPEEDGNLKLNQLRVQVNQTSHGI